MILSKSNYMLFLKHPAWLWLKKHDKHKLPPHDANTQVIFDAGHEFESYAEKLFPSGVKLGFRGYDEYLSLPQRTKEALDNGAATIFQGRFEAEGITCIVDVLKRVDGDQFDLIEIKSSTRAKPEYEYDLAFQKLVLKKSGINIRNISIIHVNNEYVREGEIELEKITSTTDVTGAVNTLTEMTEKYIQKAFKVLSEKDMPDISPRYVNQFNIKNRKWFGYWMDIFKTLEPDLDEYSIYHLSYPNAKQLGKLEDQGISLIQDILEDNHFKPMQLAQIQAVKTNKRTINKDQISDFIDKLKFPLHFFDYETFKGVIPAFDGIKPYQQVPFQYSLHIQKEPGGKLEHKEYLHTQKTHPGKTLLEQLKKDVNKQGSILVWYESFEKSRNQEMANSNEEYSDFLLDINDRIIDLMIPFSKMWFVDKDFFGSASIKNVLQVLVPELSYKELDISDGMLAQRIWMKTILEGKNQDRKEEILSNLSEYCTLDTFAMVKILEKLKLLTSG